MNDNTLIQFGGACKALGDGKFSAPLVTFGSEAAKDLVGDFFTAETDFWTPFPAERPLLYGHAMDDKIKSRRLGKGSAELSEQDAGIWMQGQLNLADEYEKRIYALIEDGKMGTSSGSASHLVEREKKGDGAYWVKSWPIVEASLTPCPCEPRNFGKVVPLKSLPTLYNPWGDNMGDGASNASDPAAALNTELSVAAASRLLDRLTTVVYSNLYSSDEPLSDRMDAIRLSTEQFADTLIKACNALLNSGDAAAMKAAAYFIKTYLIDRTSPLPASVPLSEEWDGALAALTAVSTRTRDVNDLRVKDGRVLSAANRNRIKEAMDILTALYKDTEPMADGGLIAKEFQRFLIREAKANGVAIS